MRLDGGRGRSWEVKTLYIRVASRPVQCGAVVAHRTSVFRPYIRALISEAAAARLFIEGKGSSVSAGSQCDAPSQSIDRRRSQGAGRGLR